MAIDGVWANGATKFSTAALVILTLIGFALCFAIKGWTAKFGSIPLPQSEATVQVLQPDGRVVNQPAPIHSSQLNWALRPLTRFCMHFVQGLVWILLLSAMADNRWSFADSDDSTGALETSYGVFSYHTDTVGTTSYKELCSNFEGADLGACRTLRAGGVFTFIGSLIALLASFALVCKTMVISCCPLQHKWEPWMDSCSQVQTLAMFYVVLVWPLVGHVTLHALTDVGLGSSWSLYLASFIMSWALLLYWHAAIAARPDGNFACGWNSVDGAVLVAQPAAVVVMSPNGQQMVVAQPVLMQGGYAQPMQPQPMYANQGYGQAQFAPQQQHPYAGQPHQMQQQPQQQYYNPNQQQPVQFHMPQEAPPAYTSGYPGQQEGGRALPPQQGYGAGAGAGPYAQPGAAPPADQTVWVDVKKPGQP